MLSMQVLKNCYNIICSYIPDFSIILFKIFQRKNHKNQRNFHKKQRKISCKLNNYVIEITNKFINTLYVDIYILSHLNSETS